MQMYFFSISFLFSTLTLNMVESLPYGPTPATCRTMYPSGFPGFGHYDAEFRDFGFTVTPIPARFKPGSDVTVMLGGLVDYRGIFLQVRNGDDLATSKAVGSWSKSIEPGIFKIIDCSIADFEPNSAISHASPADKDPFHNFTWISPDCSNGQKFFIKVTIVKNLTAVQSLISVPMTCSGSNPIELPIGQPGVVSTDCSHSALTSIPADYKNTFERRDFFRGWKMNASGGYVWRYNKGPTVSKHTGPRRAFQGLRYLYTEASYPSKPGDVAIFETRKDLRGCFCFRMAYSFNVKDKGHTLVVLAGNEKKLRVTKGFIGWAPIHFQINTPDFVKIQIIATRGSGYKGDMAIDDLGFNPGTC